MEFIQSTIAYYQGEKSEAIILAVVGLVLGALSYFLVKLHPTALAKGLFYPIAFFALFALMAGSYNTYNNAKRLSEFPKLYTENAQQLIQNEWDRFEGKNGVNRWWFPLNVTWTVFVLMGISLYFLKESFFVKGIALGVLFFGFSGLLIDGFAKQRAAKYTQHLYAIKD
jgi:hypothetical protein